MSHGYWVPAGTSFGIGIYDRTSKGINVDKVHRRGGNILLGHNLINEWDGMIKYSVENYKEYDDADGSVPITRVYSVV